MSVNPICFLSTRGREMNIDLKLIKDYLEENLSETEFHYFFKSNATKIPAANRQIEKARLSLCKNFKNIICMDSSIPIKIPSAAPGERRILSVAPYDYIFNEYLNFVENPEKPPKKTFFRCTHVIPGAPFITNLLKEHYEFEQAEILSDICSPFSWHLSQEPCRKQMRQDFYTMYPQAKGKKILSLLLVNQGNKEKDDNEVFLDFPLKEFIEKMGEEWFFITNSMDILNMSEILSFDYFSHIACMKNQFNINNLLYVSDMLITNSSKHGIAFVPTKNPVYCLDYGDKYFSKYMKDFYPSLYFEKAADMMKINFQKEILSEDEQKFYREFSYDVKENPCEKIREILEQA